MSDSLERLGAEGYAAFLAERRAQILERVAEAAARAGRDAADVEVIAVSKTVGVEEVLLAHEAGYDLFAENRPQELRRKLAGLEGDARATGITFDMIGNLQTNKVNQVIGNVRLVHSISSAHLAEAVAKRSSARGLVTDVLVETNVSGEQSKSGFSPDELRQSLDVLMTFDGICLRGLMTMAPAHDPEAARRTFCGLRELAEELRTRSGLPLDVLSCGMSDDFPIAVEQGSTAIRLGRVAFDDEYALE